MFRYLALLALAASLCMAEPADAVREAAAGWRQAAIQQDKAALDRFIADDLIYTHGSGKTESKAEYIAAVTTGPSHYTSFTPSETRIRVYGDIAVLTGYVDVVTPRSSYRVRTLEIYANNDGQWQFTAKESVRMTEDGKGISR